MQLSGLEAGLIGVVSSIGTGAVVRVWMGRSFVTVKQLDVAIQARDTSCQLVQQQFNSKIAILNTAQAKTDTKIDQMYRMMRALVVFSDIPKDKQNEILNDRGE